ncbi:hypothetical protein KAR91_84445 [Candidatus Pacearchaeota archaeon]|nr:hypothetical protein [Candidatus Pacearchaeota archaeon]
MSRINKCNIKDCIHRVGYFCTKDGVTLEHFAEQGKNVLICTDYSNEEPISEIQKIIDKSL